MKPKKRKAPETEIVNDCSLRYFPYTKWELLYSDTHMVCVRFLEYVADNMMRVASKEGIVPYEKPVPILSVRRPSVMQEVKQCQ